jgi:hypothetical protein
VTPAERRVPMGAVHCDAPGHTLAVVLSHLGGLRAVGPSSPRKGRGVVVAAAVVLVLIAGYAVVAVVADVPGSGRSWPGQGFVALAAVALVGLVSLIAAIRRGRQEGAERG